MGISIWQLLIVLVIVLLLFGTKKLKNIGTDLGGAVRGFKGAMKEGKDGEDATAEADGAEPAQLESTAEEAVTESQTVESKRESNKTTSDAGHQGDKRQLLEAHLMS